MTQRPTDLPTVTVSSPGDMVAVVPFCLGFHPAGSIVLIGLAGGRRRWIGPVMRYDLDAAADVGVGGLVARLGACGADSVFVAVYDDSPLDSRTSGAELPRADVLEAVYAAVDDQAMDLYDAVLVHDGRWRSYLCAQAACCPENGTPVPDATTGAAAAVAALAVAEGRMVMPSRADIASTVAGPTGPAAPVATRRLDRAAERVAHLVSDGGVAAVHAQAVDLVRAAVAAWSEGLTDLDDDDAAFVVSAVVVKQIRDDILTMPGLRLPPFLDYVCALARATPDPEAASICAVVAAIALRYGDGALANVAIERALRNDPDHHLSRILADMSAALVSPDIVESWCARARAQSPTGESAA